MHKTFPLTSLFVAAEGSDYGFREQRTRTAGAPTSAAAFLYNGGRTQVRAEAGPVKLDFDDPCETRLQRPDRAALDVTRNSGRCTYHAGGDRDLGFAIFRDNNYFISDVGRRRRRLRRQRGG